MCPSPGGTGDQKLLTDGTAGGSGDSSPANASVPVAGGTSSGAPSVERVASVRPVSPARQLADMPRDELDALAEEFGLEPARYKERAELVAAIHDRRQMIASFDRDAMLDVVRWGRRPVLANATREQIAAEIARIRSMRFAGLSHRGLVVLARMRGIDCESSDDVPLLVRKLKKSEGFFARLNRKRRSFIAGMVAGVIGEAPTTDYQYLPGPDGRPATAEASLKHEIEEAGLIGGISNRLKKTADSYINQKLDEIEARIDRKLDEIDRRLAEWRDKEVANRIKILKITLWASVIVGLVSLIYSYVTMAARGGGPLQRPTPQQVQPSPATPPPPATSPAATQSTATTQPISPSQSVPPTQPTMVPGE
jgi:hypothetical protein